MGSLTSAYTMGKSSLVLFFLVVVGSAYALPHDNRIHGGSDAEQGQFPYIISIRRIANAFKHMCGGVLINPEWVLTSAFCVEEVGPYSIDAVGGEHNLVMPSAHEQIRGVESIHRHPNYTHSDASVGGMAVPIDNDLALLKLKSPMTDTEYVKVINLAEELPVDGQECITAGWGSKSVTSLLMTSVLQQSPATVVSREECQEVYVECRECPEISGETFCTSAGGVSAPCFGYLWGDAGGPLVCGDQLAGVVSWGVGCGEQGFPWINTMVSFHRQWILDTMARK